MYAEFFGLKQDPFSIAPDPRYLFMSERHREALAHLLYGIQGGGGFVLLSGEIGAGKTTICRCFLEQIPAQCRVAYIFNPKLTVSDLLKTICREFHVDVRHEGIGPATIKDYLDPLNEYLLQSHARGEHNVLIIDEAQNLTIHVLEQLRLLTNLETNERKLLQIILIGQPELREALARPELEQLAQRVIARFHLSALNEAETQQYIHHRMQVAGLRGPLPFSGAALKRIHEITRGVPRRVNLLCGRALLGAYATNQPRVERAVVDKAAREVFETDAPAAKAQRRAPARAATSSSAIGLLGAGLLMGVLATGGLFWLWSHGAQPIEASATPEVAQPAAASPAVPPATPTAAPPPRPEPRPGPPDASALLKTENEAWRELGHLWGQALASDDPCTAAQAAQLQCYRTDRMSLNGLRQLDRPGILTLRSGDQRQGLVLLTALSGEQATLQIGEQRWRLPLSELNDLWQGDFATLWRTPPGQTERLVDGRSGPAADWLGERIASLQSAGKVPPSESQLTARIQSFQRTHGISAAGIAGPITFMQVNLASGVDEPRLSNTGL
ncbi:ExeA family protein [Hydrogenophaga sp. BPS33]|uniref:ExeA family protein n=1 Tax=Hydrogenophaga sp. BPS33 TaxID=2651974 RepID=UPI0013200805|nr:AAA family ATPase [Hydrogenophaga sp. BPS33]QHE85861.1 AAA family ATPase [Hydrogenophaga sp. BPS33]